MSTYVIFFLYFGLLVPELNINRKKCRFCFAAFCAFIVIVFNAIILVWCWDEPLHGEREDYYIIGTVVAILILTSLKFLLLKGDDYKDLRELLFYEI